MLTLFASLASAPAAPPAPPPDPPVQEIVVTAKRDKCFVAYAQHQISSQQLDVLSRTWALGTPVRVIEPRRAGIKCEFQIMQYLSRHGAHMAQFVARSEDQDDDPASTPPPASAATPVAPPPAVATVPAAPVAGAFAAMPPTPATGVVRGRRPRVSTAVPNASGIITLSCLMAQPGSPYRLDVEVNEAKGTVTPSRPDTGGGSEMKAVFMPDTVRFGPFTLSRTTLRIERANGGNASQLAHEPAVVDGQCELADVRRVF